MKKIILALLFISSVHTFAQLNQVNANVEKTNIVNNDTIDGWKKGGTLTFLLNQSAFSNWIAGGVNTVAGNVGVNYDFNYKKQDWTWDNKIILGYGLSSIKDQETRKTDDRLELNSLLGKKAFGNWSYSFFGNFRTQFTDGYNYEKDPNTIFATSGFFKPAYLTFGPGLMWRKHDNLKFNLAPLTSKFTILGGEIYAYDAATDSFLSSNTTTMFGVDPGASSRYELGFYGAGYYKFNIMENVSMENILALYSNYLEDPQNVDIDYTANLVMQINKYLSTNLTFQAIYDDNAFRGFQMRELFGLGFNMNF